MTTAVRGRVWRQTWTIHQRGGTHTTSRWMWGIGTWTEDAETDTWDAAYTQCVAAVIAARTPTEPPF